MNGPYPAIIFDRDNTLIVNVPYLGDPAGVRLFPETKSALDQLEAAGFRFVIVSNQSGVGRGLITEAQVDAVNQEMIRQIGKSCFRGIYNCYGAPGQPEGELRKPSPHYVLEAAKDHQLDLTRSFFIGDRLSDIECGKNAGCRTVLVLTGDDPEEQAQARSLANYTAANLLKATEWILLQLKA